MPKQEPKRQRHQKRCSCCDGGWLFGNPASHIKKTVRNSGEGRSARERALRSLSMKLRRRKTAYTNNIKAKDAGAPARLPRTSKSPKRARMQLGIFFVIFAFEVFDISSSLAMHRDKGIGKEGRNSFERKAEKLAGHDMPMKHN